MVIYNGRILAEPNDPDTVFANSLPNGQPVIADGNGKNLTTVALEASRIVAHDGAVFDQSFSFSGQKNKYLITDENGNLAWR